MARQTYAEGKFSQIRLPDDFELFLETSPVQLRMRLVEFVESCRSQTELLSRLRELTTKLDSWLSDNYNACYFRSLKEAGPEIAAEAYRNWQVQTGYREVPHKQNFFADASGKLVDRTNVMLRAGEISAVEQDLLQSCFEFAASLAHSTNALREMTIQPQSLIGDEQKADGFLFLAVSELCRFVRLAGSMPQLWSVLAMSEQSATRFGSVCTRK